MRRTCQLLMALLLTVGLLQVTHAQEAKKQEKKQKKPTASERSFKYLNEVKDHLLKSYIEGEKVDLKGLIRAAAKGIAAGMGDAAFKNAAQETRNAIAKTLGETEFESLEAVFTALRQLGETHSLKGLNWMKLADLAAVAMLEHVGDPFSHIFTLEELQRLIRSARTATRVSVLASRRTRAECWRSFTSCSAIPHTSRVWRSAIRFWRSTESRRRAWTSRPPMNCCSQKRAAP